MPSYQLFPQAFETRLPQALDEQHVHFGDTAHAVPSPEEVAKQSIATVCSHDDRGNRRNTSA
jgi:hypothetical protein